MSSANAQGATWALSVVESDPLEVLGCRGVLGSPEAQLAPRPAIPPPTPRHSTRNKRPKEAHSRE